MEHDWMLRADARRAYERARLWFERPSFEEAERLRLPSYLAAVGQAIAERDEEWALNSHAMQLQLLA